MRATRDDDIYDEIEPHPERRTRRTLMSIAAAGIALIAFAGAIWYAYHLGVQSGSDGGVPTIAAQEGSWKKRPENPGGMQVPHQDKLVYETLLPHQPEEPRKPQLLPPPEQPLPRPPEPPPEAVAAAPAETPVAEGTTAAPPLPTGTLAAPDGPATAAAPVPAPPSAEAAPAIPPADASPPATPEPPAQVAVIDPEAATSEPPAGETYRVQLASLRSDAEARAAWDKLKAGNADLLGKLHLIVTRADLGARGTYYRVQAGPLPGESIAELLCSQLKARKRDCIVVRP